MDDCAYEQSTTGQKKAKQTSINSTHNDVMCAKVPNHRLNTRCDMFNKLKTNTNIILTSTTRRIKKAQKRAVS